MATLGKYELHEVLGKGGFGTVYRATDQVLGRVVALKVLHPQWAVDPAFIERFQHEARLLATLEHPNIVWISDAGEEGGRYYLVERYLPGGSLADRIQQGPLPVEDALRILNQVCAGLQELHKQGWVHRDLKPSNILFDASGQAVITDFGLARAMTGSGGSSSSSGTAGTPFYRAPELWRGKPPASPATDVYSLGCILGEMLIGKPLFAGETPDEIITRHLVDGPDFGSPWPPEGVPGWLVQVVEKALQRDPTQRYLDAQTFAQALDGSRRAEEESRRKTKEEAAEQARMTAEERTRQTAEELARWQAAEREKTRLLAEVETQREAETARQALQEREKARLEAASLARRNVEDTRPPVEMETTSQSEVPAEDQIGTRRRVPLWGWLLVVPVLLTLLFFTVRWVVWATLDEPQQTYGADIPAPADEWASVDPTGQKVVFWHQNTKSREEALLAIVDEFNKTNEYGITVTAEYQGSYMDIFNKMLPILNTADVPDLVVAYQNQAATYQLADALVDMTPLVASPKFGLTAEEQADFFPGFFAQDIFPNFDNARLGFPPNRSMEVMYVNTDWAKELGFDGAPTTPEQFKEMACKAAATPFTKATAEGAKGYELSIDTSRFASWTFAFGGDIYDYTKGEFTLNSQAAIDAMTFLQGMFTEGCAQLVTENYGDQTDFGNGTLMFAVGSSSGMNYYKDAADAGAKHQMEIVAIPHTTAEPVMNVYGASVSMPKSTPERELAAWLFLKYYTSVDVQAKWASVSGYFPVRASVADGLTEYFAANPNFKVAFDMLKYGTFEPPVPGYDFVREEVNLAMAAIADGADVKTTLDDLNVKANEILADQMAQMK